MNVITACRAITVQLYKATSNGVVSEQDMADIADQINKVYQQADCVGSLLSTAGFALACRFIPSA